MTEMKTSAKPQYQIEGLVGGQWDASHVGSYDAPIETREEAERIAADLCLAYGCPADEIRVVEIEATDGSWDLIGDQDCRPEYGHCDHDCHTN
jgi:hypothetical protein